MIQGRQAAASKALGIKADKNWEQAEPRQRPSNKAFGRAFPGGTGPRKAGRPGGSEPYKPTPIPNAGPKRYGNAKKGFLKEGESRA